MMPACNTSGCDERVVGSTYRYCRTCRRARRTQEFAAKCLTPTCGGRFIVRARSLESLKAWKNKFCPVCRERFGDRLRALQLQAERNLDITNIIIQAGREAFDWFSNAEGRDVLARFEANLGVSYHTLHDWLKFFFGMEWPDWKRRYICAAHACSIVDVSAVKRGGRPKYYVVDKFRQKGICACPIRGDSLILVDRPAGELTADALVDRFPKSAHWTKRLNVIDGSHLDRLADQEDDD